MKQMRIYKVVAVIGRKHNIIYETKPFDMNDGHSASVARQEANQERSKYCQELWDKGYSLSIDGRYHHIGKNLEAGRIEVYLYKK